MALALLVAVAAAVWPGGRAEAQLTLGFEAVASGLHSPVGVTHAGDGSRRLFILEQAGRILIHDGSRVLPSAFLDVSALVSCCGERGLLGLAFHPDYVTNGLFYLDYTNTAGDTVIARYHVSADANVADPSSAQILLTIAQPFANHNGGQLAFGPDGFLYIGMGDGGSGGDPGNRAQNLGELLGKILRIDVNGAAPYAIPATNPFRSTPGARPEIRSVSATRGASASTGSSGISSSPTSVRTSGRRWTSSRPRAREARTTAGAAWRGPSATTRRAAVTTAR